jgi:hypothetical protein
VALLGERLEDELALEHERMGHFEALVAYDGVFKEQDVEIHGPGAFVDDPHPAEIVFDVLEAVEKVDWVQVC